MCEPSGSLGGLGGLAGRLGVRRRVHARRVQHDATRERDTLRERLRRGVLPRGATRHAVAPIREARAQRRSARGHERSALVSLDATRRERTDERALPSPRRAVGADGVGARLGERRRVRDAGSGEAGGEVGHVAGDEGIQEAHTGSLAACDAGHDRGARSARLPIRPSRPRCHALIIPSRQASTMG